MKNVRSTFLLSFFLLALALTAPVLAQSQGMPDSKPDKAADKTNKGNKVADFTRPEQLMLIERGVVKEVVKSDMVLLYNNKRYRLDNIRIPVEYNTLALDELNKALLNRKVILYTYHEDDTSLDRYGVPLAHVVRDDGTWIQGDLVSKGLAWVFSSETSPKMAEPMRKLETEARDRQLGFWADPAFAIKTPDAVKSFTGSFQIVEGKIRNVSTMKQNIFLNFGKDWKEDFTIRIDKRIWTKISPTTVVRTWKNNNIRIRGWVEDNNGPLIDLTHAEQIELFQDLGP